MKFKYLFAFSLVVVVACLVDRLTGQTSTGSGIALDALPRELEVKLALSALPRSEANVYVLDPAKAYVLERQGKDNFTCFVERTDWVREDFRNDLFIPECFDAEGTRTIVPVSFDVAKFRAEGKLTPQELGKENLTEIPERRLSVTQASRNFLHAVASPEAIWRPFLEGGPLREHAALHVLRPKPYKRRHRRWSGDGAISLSHQPGPSRIHHR